MTRVKSLHIYPVKSLRGIDLPESEIGIHGLQFDRTWMVTDHSGKFITQRHYPALAKIQTEIGEKDLILSHPDYPELRVPLQHPITESDEVTIWDDQVKALDEGADAAHWLTEILGQIEGQNLRLYRFKPGYKRSPKRDLKRETDVHTAFADGYPILITSVESLALLNDNLKRKGSLPVQMNRFRPNIVIEGVKAFGEDSINSLISADGRYSLGILKPCQRCHVTTIDQITGKKIEPKEPLRTLLEMNTQPDRGGPHFGQNSSLLHGKDQIIRVGDELRALL